MQTKKTAYYLIILFIGLLFFAVQPEVLAQKKDKKGKKEKDWKKDKDWKNDEDRDDGSSGTAVGNQYISFTTDATCIECEAVMQMYINQMKGVKSTSLNTSNGVVTIRYNANFANPQIFKTTLLNAGFSIDGEKGNKDARKNLPDCCK